VEKETGKIELKEKKIAIAPNGTRFVKVGITGGIGSGKSTAGEYLKGKGYAVYDCDDIAKELSERDDIKAQLKKAFGESFFIEDRLDRRALGSYVFKDKKRAEALNGIFFPAVIDKVKAILEEKGDSESVFIVAPLLFEAKMEMLFHETWCIATSENIQKERVRVRGGMTEEEMINRMGAQLSFYERLDRVDRIINNNGSLEDFFAETEEILKEALKVPLTVGDISGWKNVKAPNLLMPRHDEGDDDEDDE